MKAGELKKHIQEKIKEKLNPLGFKKSENWYYIYETGFTSSILISSLNYDNSFPTSFSIAFGFVGVDKILISATLGNEESKNKKIGGQIFIRQQELFDQGKYPIKAYDIYTLEEANQAIQESLYYFLNSVIPEYSELNIQDLESKINLNDVFTNDRFLSNKLKYGLILAKLVNNPSYESLKIKYRELLKDWSDWDKLELEKVIEFLDNHSQEELIKISETT